MKVKALENNNFKIKKMKKLRNIKIYVDGKSREIQEKLFDLDEHFNGFIGRKKVLNEEYPFLFVNESKTLGYGDDMTFFKNHEYREVKASEILAMKKPEKDYSDYKLEPFERVLVRNSKNAIWRANHFSHKPKNVDYYVCGGLIWNYCIQYKGNDHLLNTSIDINE